MAYQFSTGWDHYTTASDRWTTVSGTVTISSASARFGGSHSQGAAFGANAFVTKGLTGTPTTVIVGFAIKATTLPTGGNIGELVRISDGGTVQVALGVGNTGTLQFYRSTPTTNPIGTSGSTPFAANVWHFLEVQVTINASTGDAKCWLDGVQVINSSSNLNTRQSANTQATSFSIGNISGGLITAADDVYCFDGTGGSLNAPLGDRRIITIMPNGAGSFSQFTPTGAAANWQCVDEIPSNDNTDYVADATVNDRDSYAYEDVTFNGNADFVVNIAKISKDDAGSHTVQLTVTDSGNDAFSSSIAVPSSYAYVDSGAFTTSPNGAAALSQTVVNRMEFGIKIIS